ncbi:MAG: hypothetical protein LBL85_01300, partial [Methanocalculaceae archaeon]|nr:hypothetical protein [Methanocalculaceae archaeon]
MRHWMCIGLFIFILGIGIVSPVIGDTEYAVGDTEAFQTAWDAMNISGETEITIIFTADSINVKKFSGVAGKHITLQSTAGQQFTISNIGVNLIGNLTFDNVRCYNSDSNIYANSHLFETTENFTGGIGYLYGGGNEGMDVNGDTHLVLRGGNFDNMYGGGRDSNVSGSTHILVDNVAVRTGNLFGGGYAHQTPHGIVGGDTHIHIRQGTNGLLFGGGQNSYSTTADSR